jgi:hypothetical protein
MDARHKAGHDGGETRRDGTKAKNPWMPGIKTGMARQSSAAIGRSAAGIC